MVAKTPASKEAAKVRLAAKALASTAARAKAMRVYAKTHELALKTHVAEALRKADGKPKTTPRHPSPSHHRLLRAAASAADSLDDNRMTREASALMKHAVAVVNKANGHAVEKPKKKPAATHATHHRSTKKKAGHRMMPVKNVIRAGF